MPTDKSLLFTNKNIHNLFHYHAPHAIPELSTTKNVYAQIVATKSVYTFFMVFSEYGL